MVEIFKWQAIVVPLLMFALGFLVAIKAIPFLTVKYNDEIRKKLGLIEFEKTAQGYVRSLYAALDYPLVKCADNVDENIRNAFHNSVRIQKAAFEEFKAGRLKYPVDQETALRFILDYLRALSPEKEASE